jgi:hypothetical protein
MLPKNINDWIVSNPRPINRYGKEYEKIINNLFSSCSVQHLKDYMIVCYTGVVFVDLLDFYVLFV